MKSTASSICIILFCSLAAAEIQKTTALLFAPSENGVELSAPLLEYSVDQKENVRLGNLDFRAGVFSVGMEKEGVENGFYLLKFHWLQSFMSSGLIELKNSKNDVLVSHSLSAAEASRWFNMAGDKTVLDVDSVHFDLKVSAEEVRKWDRSQKLRFCMNRTVGDRETSFCTKWYELSDEAGTPVLRAEGRAVAGQSAAKVSHVFFDDQEAPLAGERPLGVHPVMFRAELTDGAMYRLQTSAPTVEFLSVGNSTDAESVWVKTQGAVPSNSGALKEEGDIWVSSAPARRPRFYFYSENGIPVRIDVSVKQALPPAQNLSVAAHGISGTYKSHANLILRKSQNDQIALSSEEWSIVPRGDTEYLWDFKADRPFQDNVSRLKLTDANGHTAVGGYSLYRGYPYEASFRLTGIRANESGFLLLGEVAASAWFERVLKSESRALSVQRWGIAARYFDSLNKINDSSGRQVRLAFSNIDIKYRFTPGLWNHDGTVGAMIGLQSTIYSGVQADMGGVGLFWARSLPGVLDRGLSKLSLFNHPKWVEMEVQYYPVSLRSNTALGTCLNVLFHGKIFIKPNWFVEAGLGYKKLSFVDQTSNFQANVGTIFGTGGLGIDF